MRFDNLLSGDRFLSPGTSTVLEALHVWIGPIETIVITSIGTCIIHFNDTPVTIVR